MSNRSARIDERTLVRRQLRAATRTFLRPSAYAGAARELALGAAHVALYPLGVMRARPQSEPALPPPSTPTHPALRADPATAEIPVVLIHGYIHNRSAFLVMSRQLRHAGFRYVHGLNYNPLRNDVGELAEMLSVEVDRIRTAAESDQVMLVGHSMGGIVARFYTQELAPPGIVDTVLTLATPHRGTYSTYLAPGPAARDLRPGSRLIRRLEEGARPSNTRWLSYWSDLDAFVTPAVHGKIVHPALHATNVRLRDTGHLSLLMSREVTSSVVDHLADRQRGWHHRWQRHDTSEEPSSRNSPPTGRRRHGLRVLPGGAAANSA